MWQDLRCKSNTVFPFTFHKTLTDRILESFYKVKGDVAQQRKSLWEAEQFSGIESSFVRSACSRARGWIHYCFPGSFGSGVVAEELWRKGGGTSPEWAAPVLCPASPSPPRSIQGWGHSKSRENWEQNPLGKWMAGWGMGTNGLSTLWLPA